MVEVPQTNQIYTSVQVGLGRCRTLTANIVENSKHDKNNVKNTKLRTFDCF